MTDSPIDATARIAKLLSVLHADPSTLGGADSGVFVNEGFRKTRFIVDDILALHEDRIIDATKWAVISIGGADGSDLVSILLRTPVCEAVLLEYSDESVLQARKNFDAYLPPTKHAESFTGDAGQKITKAIEYLRPLRESGKVEGVILVFLAILHELPDRSRYFNFREMLGDVGDLVDQNVLLYASEPTVPLSWTDQVILKIGNATARDLARLAEALRDKWKMPWQIGRVGQGRVQMPRELATEVLFKLVREHDEKRDYYELQERLTSFNLEDVTAQLRQALPGKSTEIDTARTVSRGFRDAYRRSDVEVRSVPDERRLEMPDSHSRIILRHVITKVRDPGYEHMDNSGDSQHSESEIKADLFRFHGLQASMLVFDYCPMGYAPNNILTRLTAWDEPVVPETFKERLAKAFEIADDQEAKGLINDNPIYALRRMSISRVGERELQGLTLDFSETTYKPKRAKLILFNRLLSKEERAQLIDESKDGLHPLFSNSFSLQLGVVSSDNKLMIVRRGSNVPNPGRITCGIAETMQVTDRRSEPGTIRPDIYGTALRGLEEEAGVYLSTSNRHLIHFNSILLDVDYYEVVVSGFVDLTRVPRGMIDRCKSTQLLESFHNGASKDKWENKEVKFISSELNSAVEFLLEWEGDFTNYGLICFVNILRVMHGDDKVRDAIDRWRSKQTFQEGQRSQRRENAR